MYHKAINSLVKAEPCLKTIIDHSSIRETVDPAFPVAAVSVINSKIHLILSSPKFSKLKGYEKVAVLAHEYAHPLLGHLDIRKLEHHDQFLVGIAHDLAVNSLLHQFKLPKSFILPKMFGLEERLSSEVYLDKLSRMDKSQLMSRVRIPTVEPLPLELLESNKVIKSIVKNIPIKQQIFL